MDKLTKDQIDERFKIAVPVSPVANAMTRDFRELAYRIVHASDSGREQSLALTNLEQAMFWCNQAMVASKT